MLGRDRKTTLIVGGFCLLIDILKITAKGQNFVYVFGNPVENFDPNTFENFGIDNVLVKDKNGVYFAGFVLRSEDEDVDNEFDFDENSLINCGDLLQDLAWNKKERDGRFELIQKGNENTFVISRIDGLDPETLQIMDYDGIMGRYIKDKNAVYLFIHSAYDGVDKMYSLVKIEDADQDSFVIVDDFYLKDKNTVFAIFHMPYRGEPYFKPILGSDPGSFEVITDRSPARLRSHYYYIGVTGEDSKYYYARELAILKNKKIVEWVGNYSEPPLSCKDICSSRGLIIAEKSCYDTNFSLCTVSDAGVCISGDENTVVSNDYRTSCCCSGSNFAFEYEDNEQLNFCVSTDGADPFTKGVTRATSNVGNRVDTNGTTVEDKCEENKVIDY